MPNAITFDASLALFALNTSTQALFRARNPLPRKRRKAR
jgi:hypothetical protein